MERGQPAKQAGVAPQEAGYASGDMEVYAVAEASTFCKFSRSFYAGGLRLVSN